MWVVGLYILFGMFVVAAWTCVFAAAFLGDLAYISYRAARKRRHRGWVSTRWARRKLGEIHPSFRSGMPLSELRVAEFDQLASLTPQQFEHAVATVLADAGFKRVRVCGG